MNEVPVLSVWIEAEVRIHEESNVHSALGEACEDRVHVVVSEEHGWLFVGIYDGFNGPDAPEFLMANFYRAMYNELQGLFWEVEQEQPSNVAYENVEIVDDISAEPPTVQGSAKKEKFNTEQRFERFAFSVDDAISVNKAGFELVLNTMLRALHMTEAAYLDMIDKFLDRNPELALMGSCLLVVLMRDADVYVMNSEHQEEVGPSVDLEEAAENGASIEGIVKEPPKTLSEKVNEMVKNHSVQVMKLTALQLSTDNNTSIKEEVLRIKSELQDDSQCIVNDRVKGRLKVTRAFGAAFLKQHLTNQEVVSHVDRFMKKSPEGDPAQHLIEELMSPVAKKVLGCGAGLNWADF
ncbi:hypothetical protein QQ045_032229 [Rhodiola kirilowii]